MSFSSVPVATPRRSSAASGGPRRASTAMAPSSSVSPPLGSCYGGDGVRSASRAGSISTLWSSADIPLFLDQRSGSAGSLTHAGSSFSGGGRVGSIVSVSSFASGWQPMARGSSSTGASSGAERERLCQRAQLIEEEEAAAEDAAALASMARASYAAPSRSQEASYASFSSASSLEPRDSVPALSVSYAASSRQSSIVTPTTPTFPASATLSADSPRTRLQKQRPSALQLDGVRPAYRDISAPSMPVSVSYGSHLTCGSGGATPMRAKASANSLRSGAILEQSSAPPLPSPARAPVEHRRRVTQPSNAQLYAQAEQFFQPNYTMVTPPAPDASERSSDSPLVTPVRRSRQRQSTSTFETDDSRGMPSHDESGSSSSASVASSHGPREQEDSGIVMSDFLSSLDASRPTTAPGATLFGRLGDGKSPSPVSSPLRAAVKLAARGRPHTGDASAPCVPRKISSRTQELRSSAAGDGRGLDGPSAPERSFAERPGSSGRERSVSARLRSAVSTPRLRPLSSGWRSRRDEVEVPALPSPSLHKTAPRSPPAPSLPAPSLLSGRGRSHTVGEAERKPAGLSFADLPPLPSRSPAHASSAHSDLPPSRLRTPSRADTTASSVASSMRSFTQGPNSSTPELHRGMRSSSQTSAATSTARPKSKGGWASHLADGLTLHIEHEGRMQLVNMSYLYYDPFGKAEDLCSSEAASLAPGQRSLTPKRPKSKGGRDDGEEQIGTLEFELLAAADVAATLDFAAHTGPVLRHLTIGNDKADLLTRQATLSLSANGTSEVSGSERKGRLAWRLIYNVEESSQRGNKVLRPLKFSCSATLLDPLRARKGRLLNMVRKQIFAPNLASIPVIGLPAPQQLAAQVTSPCSSTMDDSSSTSTGSAFRGSSCTSAQLSPAYKAAYSEPAPDRDEPYAGRPSTASSSSMSSRATGSASCIERLPGLAVPGNLPPSLVPFKMSRRGLVGRAAQSLPSNSPGHSIVSLPASPLAASHLGRSAAPPSPASASFNIVQRQPTSAASAAPPTRHLAAPPVTRARGASLGEASRKESNNAIAALLPQLLPASPIVARGSNDAEPQLRHAQSRRDVHVFENDASPKSMPARKRAATSVSSRPPTASEQIKAAYLARGTFAHHALEQALRPASASTAAESDILAGPRHPSLARLAPKQARPSTADVLCVPRAAAAAEASTAPWRASVGARARPQRPPLDTHHSDTPTPRLHASRLAEPFRALDDQRSPLPVNMAQTWV